MPKQAAKLAVCLPERAIYCVLTWQGAQAGVGKKVAGVTKATQIAMRLLDGRR